MNDAPKDLRLGDRVMHRGYEHLVCGRVKPGKGAIWFVLIIAPSDHFRVSADWVDVDDVELVARANYETIKDHTKARDHYLSVLADCGEDVCVSDAACDFHGDGESEEGHDDD